jgi:hypothetical protein
VIDEAAQRHGVAPAEDTSDADEAYRDRGGSGPVRYREGWLP